MTDAIEEVKSKPLMIEDRGNGHLLPREPRCLLFLKRQILSLQRRWLGRLPEKAAEETQMNLGVLKQIFKYAVLISAVKGDGNRMLRESHVFAAIYSQSAVFKVS